MFRFKTPCVSFNSFHEYVETTVRVRTRYQTIISEELEIRLVHTRWVNELAMCGWSRLLHDGPTVLHAATKFSPDHVEWTREVNSYIVFALRSALVAFLCESSTPTIGEIRGVMRAIADSMLGFPDCCWGWHGSGVLRELLSTSFYAFVYPASLNLVPKCKWPLHEVAMMMCTHTRLGRKSPLHDVDSEILRYILQLVLVAESMQRNSVVLD